MLTLDSLHTQSNTIAVVGLGYVGLPLAVAFDKYFKVIGFDISEIRVQELKQGTDRTGEVENDRVEASSIEYTSDPSRLSEASVIVVAVPTPIDRYRSPDLTPVRSASEAVGKHMSKGCVVVYESTVYPGLTEDICVPILEQQSGFTNGVDFKVGYSPERINPGDKEHTLESIVKVVAGEDQETTDFLAAFYGTILKAGVHKAPSIKVAEAAKVIENTQRDLNIALMNELSLLFAHMGIDTTEVLEAARTKWNFLPFNPGLVGGHCIGVDPYYLTFKAESLGYHPQVILAGRRINDNMGKYVAEVSIKMLNKNCCVIRSARIAVLGLTFKENVPDLRNTKVIDIVMELAEYGGEVLVHDPIADKDEALKEYGLELQPMNELKDLDGVIVAVPHREYADFTPETLRSWFRNKEKPVLLDVKGMYDKQRMLDAGFSYWRL